MLKNILFLVLWVASASAQAEVFMCKNPAGKTEFSDTPCKAGSSSEVVPDRDHLTQQQKDDAKQKLQYKSKEANDLAAQRSALQNNQQRREKEVTEQATPISPDVVDQGTVNGCGDEGRRNTNCDKILNDGGPNKRPGPGNRR